MKIKQTVTVRFESVYSGYSALEIMDSNGDEVHVRLTDDQYIELHELVGRKVERILEDRRVDSIDSSYKEANEVE